MDEKLKIVIVGDGETAELAYEYFTHDSPHEVVAFSVEREYAKKDELFGLPVVHFEDLEIRFPPAACAAFVAISSSQLNRVRARLYRETKRRGYRLATYISSRAFVWHNVEVGENTMIMENNVVQYGVKIGANVILWSGNHIGHQTVIGDHVFVSSHVVVSGFCEIGEYCFLGVNSSVANNVRIARDGFVGMGAVIHKDTETRKIYVGNPAKPMPDKSGAGDKDTFAAFGVKEEGQG